MLDISLKKRVSLIQNDDDSPILAAVATYMTRDLHRNKSCYEKTLPAFTIDEFKSLFRVTRGTFEALCWEVHATGGFPKFLNQEPGYDRLSIRRKRRRPKGTELAEGVAAIFPYRRYGRKRLGTGKNLCETCKWNTQFHRKISNGKTGLLTEKRTLKASFFSGKQRGR